MQGKENRYNKRVTHMLSALAVMLILATCRTLPPPKVVANGFGLEDWSCADSAYVGTVPGVTAPQLANEASEVTKIRALLASKLPRLRVVANPDEAAVFVTVLTAPSVVTTHAPVQLHDSWVVVLVKNEKRVTTADASYLTASGAAKGGSAMNAAVAFLANIRRDADCDAVPVADRDDK